MNTFTPISTIEGLLFSITKSTHTLIEETKTKPPEKVESKLKNQCKFSFCCASALED